MGAVWRVTKGTLWRLSHARLGLIAAGVAFYAMFALFPGMTATLAIFSMMSDPMAVEDYTNVAERFIPHDAFVLIEGQLEALVTGPRATLGWTTILSILIALWSARAGVAAMMLGLDVIHDSHARNGIIAFLTGIVITLALIGVMILSLAVVVAVPIALAFFHMDAFSGWILQVLPWVLMLVIVQAVLAILYKFGPEWGKVSGRIMPGTILATVLWAASSIAFSAYLTNFATYNKVYGSIGAVAALLMWLYFSVYSVLAGGALNAELEHSPRPPEDASEEFQT